MTTLHFILRYAHISMGALALVSGAAAMTFRKGSPLHARAGTVFFTAMVIMAVSGVYISIFITPIMPNIMGGMVTLYLVTTGWQTARRRPGTTGAFEIGAAILGLTVAVTGYAIAFLGARIPAELLDGFGPRFFIVWGTVALFATALDVRMISRGGLTGAARTTRHLWRMCAAMFMATASFFAGQAKLFPAPVRESGIHFVPILLVIVLLLYWLIRVRVVPMFRRMRVQRA